MHRNGRQSERVTSVITEKYLKNMQKNGVDRIGLSKSKKYNIDNPLFL